MNRQTVEAKGLVQRKGILISNIPINYSTFFEDIKARIQKAQIRAAFAVNAELLRLYWDVGRVLIERQV